MLEFTDSELLEMFKNCNFYGLNQNNFYSCIAMNIVYPKDKTLIGLYTEHGASKGVLIWDNFDWVIKLPLQEDAGDSDCSLPDSAFHETRRPGWTGQPSYTDWTQRSSWSRGDNYNTYDLTGAENTRNEAWNYCQVEVDIYREAVSFGMEELFAETVLIGEVNGFPIYKQRKATMIGRRAVYKSDSEDVVEYIRKSSRKYEDYESHDFCEIIYTHGSEVMDKYYEYIQQVGYIDDLHSDNVGYINDQFVFIDFSGFHG